MTTDKELLELAAKASGIKGLYSEGHQPYGDLSIRGINTGSPVWWCPLDDDGDALRLACNLSMDLEANQISCRCIYGNSLYSESANGTGVDRARAMRRAIVRAAAEIGRGMA